MHKLISNSASENTMQNILLLYLSENFGSFVEKADT